MEKKTKKRNRRKRKKSKRKERKMKAKKRKTTKGTRLTLVHGVRYAVLTSGIERKVLMFEVSDAFSILDCATNLIGR